MIPAEKTDTTDALDMLEDISARARAMKLGLVSYTVEDVEAVCAALRAVRRNPVVMAAEPSQPSYDGSLAFDISAAITRIAKGHTDAYRQNIGHETVVAIERELLAALNFTARLSDKGGDR